MTFLTPFSPRHTKRQAAIATRMGKDLLKRLDKGYLVDRRTRHADGKSRKRIAVPKGLR